MILRSAVTAVLFVFAFAAPAQNFGFPGKNAAAPCTGCGGVREGLLTFPYSAPLVNHAGRYVDSSTTMSVQNLGMRTVRADSIRVSPATGRIYVKLGEAVGSYPLSTFFTTRLAAPMVRVNTMNTGHHYDRYGSPLEKIAAVDSFFYAEAVQSGWTTEYIDHQVHLNDFDVDDRGYVYIGTLYFGWGIARDTGATNATHMQFVAQITDAPLRSGAVIAFKNGSTYYAVISGYGSSTGSALYNVTSPASPALVTTRIGKQHGILSWARYNAGSRLALINFDGGMRIYDYAGFASGAAPLAEHTPPTGSSFSNVAFDDNGAVWAIESVSTYNGRSVLRKFTPSGTAYTAETIEIPGSLIAAEVLSAHAGYMAIAGRSYLEGQYRSELRLLKVEDGVLREVDTEDFFRRFYHHPPEGFAPLPGPPDYYGPNYIGVRDVRLVTQNQRTYLMYSASGIGDVFELGEEVTRVPTALSLSTTPNPGVPGKSVTLNATLTRSSQLAEGPTGTIRFRAGSTVLGTAPLVPGSNGTYVASFTHSGFAAGSHVLSADYDGDSRYKLSTANHTHNTCSAPVISTQPAPVSIFAGQSATLRVVASSAAAISYQWYRGASGTTTTPLRAATNSTLKVTLTATTSYWVRVTSDCGTVNSSTATVTVKPIPQLPRHTEKAVDFNGDGRSDIFWRYSPRGSNALWLMNGATRTAASTSAMTDVAWKPVALGDFNLDGKGDVFWRNFTTGETRVWLMSGGAIVNNAVLPTVGDLDEVVEGSGDFDGDGRADLFWRNRSTGANTIWFMNGTTATPQVTAALTVQAWVPVAFGDFNGDGRDDVFWRHSVTGATSVWTMNGTARTVGASTSMSDLNWYPRGTADFNGDGRTDILLRNDATGGNIIWLMNGARRTHAGVSAYSNVWRPIALGDFDGDGRGDIFWWHTSTGETRVWLMNGGSILTNAASSSLTDLSWDVAPAK